MKFSLKNIIKLETVWNYSNFIAIRQCKLPEDSFIVVKQNISYVPTRTGTVIGKESFDKFNGLSRNQIILSDVYLNTESLTSELDSIRYWKPEIEHSSIKYDFKNIFASQSVIFNADLIAIKMRSDDGYCIKKCKSNPELTNKIIPTNEFVALNYRASNQIILDALYIDEGSI